MTLQLTAGRPRQQARFLNLTNKVVAIRSDIRVYLAMFTSLAEVVSGTQLKATKGEVIQKLAVQAVEKIQAGIAASEIGSHISNRDAESDYAVALKGLQDLLAEPSFCESDNPAARLEDALCAVDASLAQIQLIYVNMAQMFSGLDVVHGIEN